MQKHGVKNTAFLSFVCKPNTCSHGVSASMIVAA